MRNESDPIGGRHDGDQTLNAAANRQTEAAFAALAPALGGVDPVAAGFAAGQQAAWQSQRRQLWAWRAAAAVAFVGAGLSWMMPIASPGPSQLVERGASSSPSDVTAVVVVHAPQSPATSSQKLPPQSVLVMRHAVSEAGLTGLPVPSLPISANARNEPLF
jgi:hypothetical protein